MSQVSTGDIADIVSSVGLAVGLSGTCQDLSIDFSPKLKGAATQKAHSWRTHSGESKMSGSLYLQKAVEMTDTFRKQCFLPTFVKLVYCCNLIFVWKNCQGPHE